MIGMSVIGVAVAASLAAPAFADQPPRRVVVQQQPVIVEQAAPVTVEQPSQVYYDQQQPQQQARTPRHVVCFPVNRCYEFAEPAVEPGYPRPVEVVMTPVSPP